MQQERLRALGQMASGIAHDINNAISPVALYTESLLEREPGLSLRTRGYLEVIQRAIGDVAETIARMREFYRKRESQDTLLPVKLNAVIEQVLDLTKARWNDMPQQRGNVIEMRTEFAPDLPEVMGTESEIRDSLTNLIFNAVDAMPEGGALTLRTRVVHHQHSSASLVAVEVSDTGAGMDEETQRRCMEPFFTTKGERGTGLGLAMVYGMAQRHGAEVNIDSALGKGTTVHLSFEVPVASNVAVLPQSLPTMALSGLRILVIDDDPLLLTALCSIIEADGHLVVTAASGQTGITAFQDAHVGREPFAVVITDLGMPHIDGRRVASAVKAISPATPVILLTGWGQRLTMEGEVLPHVDRVLSKPPKLAHLREALAQCCTPVQA
jgi:CheY-like chemotaxis protein